MDRLDQLATALHDGWWSYKINAGYTLGPRQERGRGRMHPHMMPWHQLDESAKNQDRFIAALVLKRWLAGEEVTMITLHEAWRAWIAIQGIASHPHDEPFKKAHATSGDDHKWQLERILPLLKSWDRRKS